MGFFFGDSLENNENRCKFRCGIEVYFGNRGLSVYYLGK